MTTYCVGFAFNENKTDVLLIQKNKPQWQAGKFNGIGGKIESGESPLESMVREFKEESGLTVLNWRYVTTMDGGDWVVYVFTATTDLVFEAGSKTDETVCLLPLNELDSYDLIDNLNWLIHMCMDAKINYKVYNSN